MAAPAAPTSSSATTTTPIRIGTRRSALAIKQAELIVSLLQAAHPSLEFTIIPVSVAGDRDKTTPLSNMGKGLWTSELEAMLVASQLDLIVHCLKDMPTTLPEGCELACIPERENPKDTVIFRSDLRAKYRTLGDLPEGGVVGTSSVRRTAHLRRKYPKLVFKDLRGNIDTRLRKCEDKELGYDCIILAAAGLLRMNEGTRISQYLDSSEKGGGLLYAVGQGALALETRKGDESTTSMLRAISDKKSWLAGTAERSLMRKLEGGCSVPVGVETVWVDGDDASRLRLRAAVVSIDGSQGVEHELAEDVDTTAKAEKLGVDVAEALVKKGADKILAEINWKREQTAGTISAAAAPA